MRELKNGIKIPANGIIHLKPKGLHLMFKGLKTKIKEGKIQSEIHLYQW